MPKVRHFQQCGDSANGQPRGDRRADHGRPAEWSGSIRQMHRPVFAPAEEEKLRRKEDHGCNDDSTVAVGSG